MGLGREFNKSKRKLRLRDKGSFRHKSVINSKGEIYSQQSNSQTKIDIFRYKQEEKTYIRLKNKDE